MAVFKQRKELRLSVLADEVLKAWNDDDTFKKSVAQRRGGESFVFYEGPPSSNGLPGIHHVMARTIKDVFCRYKTLKGFQVNRKAGWDTHGLPVELGVEKELGITKEDIGKSLSVEEYNEACKKAVMRYTDVWNNLTHKMGYWVDTQEPYITYENKYIESVWWLLKQAYEKNLIYKGYTIQPFSPMAGTGLSSHELNQPGCYKNVKDTSITAQFLLENGTSLVNNNKDVYLLAWTTTPWTLPSNTALAVNKNVDYLIVETCNLYTGASVLVVLAKDLIKKVFSSPYVEFLELVDNKKQIPYKVIQEIKGEELVGLKYKQLIPLAMPAENKENAFQVIHGDFVSTEDGTGIVHIAPTFGADDAKVAKDSNIPPLLVKDEDGELVPLVNLKGAFVAGLGKLSGKFVKNSYYKNEDPKRKSVDVEIAIKLKEENKAFRVEKYKHSYPHCWRTDQPILYYPLDSWFIKVSAFKEDMVVLNKSINWKPSSTGLGRFGNWLENANDWNLSRSRFWGIPIPIWRSEDKKEVICIGSVEELKKEIDFSIKMGNMTKNPLKDFIEDDFSKENYAFFDLHKSHVDKVVLSSKEGKALYRESDLIDVWFDSGAMPFAQWHYPFENSQLIDENKAFPADFIAEGVDQTRGWFYTLHAIATMTKNSVAYKNVVSNGLVLDKNGQKMSKRLGNAVDPFKTLEKYGPDATRWYMISNAQPWDNLKFDLEGIEEVTRKFFGTLHNTYSFFSLYANLDNYEFVESNKSKKLVEIDDWILSKLHSLIKSVGESYEDYEPTRAARLIQSFVIDDVSNWYVRLCRKRFWKGEFTEDKKAAYDTLFVCLKNISLLMSPIAPFYSDVLFKDLGHKESVHLADFPVFKLQKIKVELESKMELAQKVSSLILRLRKITRIKVRQPLQRVLIPSLDDTFKRNIEDVEDIILNEVNIKNIELISFNDPLLKKRAIVNFKVLGPKQGKNMKEIATNVTSWSNEDIVSFETSNFKEVMLTDGTIVNLSLEDIEIITADVPGWEIASNGSITVALDVSISEELREEGLARDFVNKIQNNRKDLGLEVTDFIEILVFTDQKMKSAINNNLNYICSETLTKNLSFKDSVSGINIFEEDNLKYSIKKLN